MFRGIAIAGLGVALVVGPAAAANAAPAGAAPAASTSTVKCAYPIDGHCRLYYDGSGTSWDLESQCGIGTCGYGYEIESDHEVQNDNAQLGKWRYRKGVRYGVTFTYAAVPGDADSCKQVITAVLNPHTGKGTYTSVLSGSSSCAGSGSGPALEY